MSRLNVNPTRMELKKLKSRLKTATRGHKLLKDKTDEMVRRFSVLIKENKKLRDEVENDVSGVLSQFSIARSMMRLSDIERAFCMPSAQLSVVCDKKTIMNVEVPKLSLVENKSKTVYPYFFGDYTSEADESIKMVGKVLIKLVQLAELEKTTQMLADEIEKGKRRVNALEYVMIPNLIETIKYISMKLEENERGSRTRLMKVKTMLEERVN